MSFSISTPKTTELLRFDSLLVLTRTAIGLGVGMMMAGKIKQPFRQAAGLALVSIGALAAVPFLVKLASEQINRTELGTRARLRSIRSDAGYPSDVDVY